MVNFEPCFFRVKDYMKINCKLIDPDGGVNLAKKKARLGLCENISPKSPDEFPREGYNDDLSDVPVVDYNIIWKFMVQNVSGKGTSTTKPLIKGYNFFKSGHVVKLEKHLSKDGMCHLRGKILPSMKKSTSYTAFITLRDGKILRAKCGCPAGIEGHRNYVSSMLFFVEEFCEHNAKNAACTSQPCTWNKPIRKRKVDNYPIHQVKFVKHEHGKKKSDADGLRQSKDVRAPHQRNLDRTELYDVKCKLENLASKGQEIGLLHILPRKSTEEVLEDISHDHGYCKRPSDTEHIISPPKVHPISLQELKECCSRIKRKLALEEDQIKVIERETKEQSLNMESNLKWNEARNVRITASKCKRVASMKQSTSPVAALQEILHYKQPFQTDFMKEGLDKEPDIINEYIAQMQKDGHEVTVKKSGFTVSASHGFLGASPDGLVHDPLECTPDGLIEVKHIVLQGGETLKAALIRKGICKMFGGHISINRNHQYYFQIHQQMFCCSRIWTDFVVKGGTEMYKERVHFIHSFWSEQLPKLDNFFDKIVLPELAYPKRNAKRLF